MSQLGPAEFNQPYNKEPWIVIDEVSEVQLLGARPGEEVPRAAGASILGMADGSAVVQLDFRDVLDPQNPEYLEWRFTLQADVEEEWFFFKRAQAAGRPFFFVPHRVESEVFRALAAATTFQLRRFTAKSKSTIFDAAASPNRAFLDGVEQTIIESGTPIAGEVKIDGVDVETPALTGGEILEIRYYPAYAVVVPSFPERFPNFNQRESRFVMIETNRQVPV